MRFPFHGAIDVGVRNEAFKNGSCRRVVFPAGCNASGDQPGILDSKIIEPCALNLAGFSIKFLRFLKVSCGQRDFRYRVYAGSQRAFIVLTASKGERLLRRGLGLVVAMLLVENTAESIKPINAVSDQACF